MRGDDQLPARRHSLAPVDTYEIEKQQFNYIQDAAISIGVPLSSAFALLPVAITLNITIVTVTISDVRKEAIMWAITVAFYLVGFICAIFAFVQRGQLKRYMADIRNSQVPPVAAKGASGPPDLTAVSDLDGVPTIGDKLDEQKEDVSDGQ